MPEVIEDAIVSQGSNIFLVMLLAAVLANITNDVPLVISVRDEDVPDHRDK
jgi:hypothetical protein